MLIINGQGVSNGVAHAPIFFYIRKRLQAQAKSGHDPRREAARLLEARRQAIGELRHLANAARIDAGDEAAKLFDMHAMLLEDKDYTQAISARAAQGFSAEYAAQQGGQQCAALFQAMDDPYLQARAADILDVTDRLLKLLMGISQQTLQLDRPCILCSDDLSPSETVRLDKSKILAIATQAGSASSHTAILARAMGIPAVCALGADLNESLHGRDAFVIGETGQVILDPDTETLQNLSLRLDAQARCQASLEGLANAEDVTLDGRRVELCCNISAPEEVQAVLDVGGQGIGLFRSEFLYLAGTDYPSEQAQFSAYRQAVSAMGGRRVVIRTLDIGGDKQAEYFHLAPEANPAMGLRGIRVSLSRPEVFHTQLRALYRASAYGKLAIMFPMITSPWEVEQCRLACGQVMEELAADGIPFSKETELGIMIETPAAVWMAPELARMVDFFSVGTNDLSQYTLACDRQNGHLGRFFHPHHPAVLRGVKLAAEAAHQAGIWIGICGDLAADPQLLPTFLAMGIDELSVPPSRLLSVRAAIRQTRAADCDFRLLEG